MPRFTYANRLEAIISNPHATKRDRDFAGSLLSFYKRKGRLTPGRARCVKDLEARYSPEAIAERQNNAKPVVARIRALIDSTSGLSEWEGDFLNSLMVQAQYKDLSEAQNKTLDKIVHRHSPHAVAERKAWASSYVSDGCRDKAIVAARYYATTGYFSDLAHKIIDDDNFVPTLKQYKAITGNKYASKVLAAWFDEPKYALKSLVTLRTGAPYAARRGAGDKPCIVIQHNAGPVVSAARGAKVYKLLPFGAPTPILVEERHIKKARKTA